MEARGTAEGEGMLLLRQGRRRSRGGVGGDLLGALPVLLCSGACARSRTRCWGGGLGWAWSRGRGRTGALGVVHVLSSGPGVRLPMGVVVLFRRKRGEKSACNSHTVAYVYPAWTKCLTICPYRRRKSIDS